MREHLQKSQYSTSNLQNFGKTLSNRSYESHQMWYERFKHFLYEALYKNLSHRSFGCPKATSMWALHSFKTNTLAMESELSAAQKYQP